MCILVPKCSSTRVWVNNQRLAPLIKMLSLQKASTIAFAGVVLALLWNGAWWQMLLLLVGFLTSAVVQDLRAAAQAPLRVTQATQLVKVESSAHSADLKVDDVYNEAVTAACAKSLTLNWSWDQVADTLENKYKLPLPDSDNPSLINLVIELPQQAGDQTKIVRNMTFSLESVPSAARKALGTDDITFQEQVLIDRKNKVRFPWHFNQKVVILPSSG